jgi:NAD(P)-dependent dehydrogenase (short-subunit alcohol dehydrogenase family)
MKTTNEFDGKVVFVAGGTSGINLGIARRFAAEGAWVTVLSRDQMKVDAAVAGLGSRASGFSADVRDAAAVSAAVRETAALRGPLDVVVSGAAGNFPAGIGEMSPNAFGAVVDIDLKGTFHVMRAAWEHLRKPGACLLNITAFQSWAPTLYQGHVCAAKAGIDQLTRTAAMEWGPAGVRVNSIAPGPIEGTEGMRRLAPDEAAARATTAAVPLGRWGTTDDVAEAALWLASERASFVTGVVLSVDGGLSLGGSSALQTAIKV